MCSKNLLVILFVVVLAGCSSFNATYPYRVENGDCDCQRYFTMDSRWKVSYAFSAEYSVDEKIVTRIVVDITNETADTLDLSLAHVKINSRNVPYRFNGKFVPLNVQLVLPGGRQTLTLIGEALPRDTGDPWFKMSGEQLVLTLKGMRLKDRKLAQQVVTFVPYNPRLGT
jgi:hypothetical protein